MFKVVLVELGLHGFHPLSPTKFPNRDPEIASTILRSARWCYVFFFCSSYQIRRLFISCVSLDFGLLRTPVSGPRRRLHLPQNIERQYQQSLQGHGLLALLAYDTAAKTSHDSDSDSAFVRKYFPTPRIIASAISILSD
jgi:hypothetical protein